MYYSVNILHELWKYALFMLLLLTELWAFVSSSDECWIVVSKQVLLVSGTAHYFYLKCQQTWIKTLKQLIKFVSLRTD